MRLRILKSGHGFSTKALFALIRTVSRQPVLDVVKLVKYRADFYGRPMGAITQEAMRGPSTWSVGDRELMAAFVANTYHSEFCTKAHSAVALEAYHICATNKQSSLTSERPTLTRPENLSQMQLEISATQLRPSWLGFEYL